VDECKPLAPGLPTLVHAARGRAVQVDPTKPMLQAHGTNRLKLKYDKLLSRLAFKLKLRRYTEALDRRAVETLLTAQAYMLVGLCRLTL